MSDTASRQAFIDYLQTLAPEGETILLVRQKPALYKGSPQLHADGTPRYTWPALLPTAQLHESWHALYANTASFIIDRFENGKPSAAAANCEYIACMVLDDIGTKSNQPLLPPTWIIETSPGNFQWGYAFNEEQPTKADFTAAVRALADAGYTDPGACNAVRNFRIPGSINLKEGKGRFASRLVEFHPERQYTLGDICEAHSIAPTLGDGNAPRPIRLSDTGSDDVLVWLSERGRVLTPPNTSGWCGVVCPNASAHSDANPEARYLPATRAFCCYHGHCVEWDSGAFLKWVAEQGGPNHQPGLRDDLLSTTMANALAQIEPSAMFSDSAQAHIEEVEQKQLGRVQKEDWYERFAYIETDDCYFDLQDRRELTRGVFNAVFRHVTCRSIHNGRRIEASTCYDENRQARGAKSLAGVTFAPGDGVLVSRNGLVYGNRWRNARPDLTDVEPGDVSPWLDHVEKLIPDAGEREHVLNVMACKLQHPTVKINHAVLHGGTQGCGKDTLWAPLLWAVCGPDMINRGLVDNDSLQSQWGYALESEILILNELKEPEAAQRRALANRLKPIIAAPPTTLTINRKGLHPYDMANRVLVLAFTNDRVPISLESQDRRWFCLWSSAPRMKDAEARALWGWYARGGLGRVAVWLAQRDVRAFDPAQPPAWTEFKAGLIEHGMSMAEAYLVDMMRRRQGEFARGVVASPFYALCDRLAAGAPAGVKIPQSALLHALDEAGWVDMGRVASVELPTKKYIWRAPELEGTSKSDLRRMVETTAPALTVVKGGRSEAG